MRINMTYRNSCTTSADFCPTIGHDVFTEGAFEGIYRAILTTDKDTCEFQFQVATITWTTKDGQDRHYTFDGGRITVDGVERWFEIKAHASYFKLPDVADVLDQAERALAAHDIALDRIDGSALLDHARLRAVNGVLRHRNVPYKRDGRRGISPERRHPEDDMQDAASNSIDWDALSHVAPDDEYDEED